MSAIIYMVLQIDVMGEHMSFVDDPDNDFEGFKPQKSHKAVPEVTVDEKLDKSWHLVLTNPGNMSFFQTDYVTALLEYLEGKNLDQAGCDALRQKLAQTKGESITGSGADEDARKWLTFLKSYNQRWIQPKQVKRIKINTPTVVMPRWSWPVLNFFFGEGSISKPSKFREPLVACVYAIATAATIEAVLEVGSVVVLESARSAFNIGAAYSALHLSSVAGVMVLSGLLAVQGLLTIYACKQLAEYGTKGKVASAALLATSVGVMALTAFTPVGWFAIGALMLVSAAIIIHGWVQKRSAKEVSIKKELGPSAECTERYGHSMRGSR